MSSPAGLFCEHKRLRTSCPACRPPPPPPKAEKPAKRAAPAKETLSGAAEPEDFRPTGPGKPLMPKRKPRTKAVSAAEAEQAEAWWVKK